MILIIKQPKIQIRGRYQAGHSYIEYVEPFSFSSEPLYSHEIMKEEPINIEDTDSMTINTNMTFEEYKKFISETRMIPINTKS